MRALIVSNEAEETALLSLIADWIGCEVVTAAGTQEAMAQQVLAQSDVIVLVAGNHTALREVRRIRRETQALLLVVTMGLSDELHAALLDAGADLGVDRPYHPRLFASQMRALVRRAAQPSPVPYSIPDELELDRSSRTARIGDGQVHQLSPLEFRLLEVLLAQRGKPIPPETIITQVWNYGSGESTDLVRKLVNRLRAKIEPDPSNPEYVITVPGAGYTVRESGVEWHLDGEEIKPGVGRAMSPPKSGS
jgi:two-component system, OmpR family, KDP operon response regulator KdpE